MDWKWYLLFAGMWLVGMFVYSTFGTQIAIMGRCGKKLYYALYGERDSWDAEACKQYMGRVKRRNWIILAVATGLVYWLAGTCFWGYVCGVFFSWLISRGATGCNAVNVGEACKIFLRFAKFGKEDYIKSYMGEILQKPEALAAVQRPKDMPKTPWGKILLWVIVGAAALYGAWVLGVKSGAEAQETIMAEQMDAAVKQAALDAKSEGKHEQLSRDKKSMEYNGTTAAKIARRIKAIYGMPPQDAYEIVAAYNENGNHGGYSLDEYQEALEAVLRTASMFDGK